MSGAPDYVTLYVGGPLYTRHPRPAPPRAPNRRERRAARAIVRRWRP